jgi:hypothetical protein
MLVDGLLEWELQNSLSRKKKFWKKKKPEINLIWACW